VKTAVATDPGDDDGDRARLFETCANAISAAWGGSGDHPALFLQASADSGVDAAFYEVDGRLVLYEVKTYAGRRQLPVPASPPMPRDRFKLYVLGALICTASATAIAVWATHGWATVGLVSALFAGLGFGLTEIVIDWLEFTDRPAGKLAGLSAGSLVGRSGCPARWQSTFGGAC
jgi:hypothetical protein